ncbi:MAG TPA: ferrous iron transport protein B [Syntrophorhabdaceae bacterium]|nr:ferrous iron transport protein B [Syntrophorhabdaceae bacterium]HOL06624.1 ferrous iron transport protein B [Syntrophorhabdaceae bacterium]HON86511.1 ferrous iron transport protein B [Syntrophorhabdaceae bacterium]HOT41386.1 ferrous iron transport protein B [Syntrophorhabdaceae bacterium]HPC67485.1 ferrous iron transport protein B [Syntrophorhabdaceae bacterium]
MEINGQMNEDLVPLSLLDEGEEGVIYSFSGGRKLISRLASIGIVPGVKIKILRNTGNLIIVLTSDTRVALGRRQAERITVARITPVLREKEEEEVKKTILVALAGQPNVGKSTVFNVLTGLSQHVGNWPGKTVEKKEGVYIDDGIELKIIDLPGTYSLGAFSEEEKVARDYIIQEHPDIVVLIANATVLERSLYLLSELLLLETPIIVAINMLDVAEENGIQIDIEALKKSLGLPVVPMIATKNRGIKELVKSIIDFTEGRLEYNPRLPLVSKDHQDIFLRLVELIKGHIPMSFTETWVATKLMEGDPDVSEIIKDTVPPERWNEIQTLLIRHEDALRAVVGGRYDWIEDVTRAAISRFKRGEVLTTDRIDHVLTRPIIGIPILLGILAVVFILTFKIGFPIQKYLEFLVSSLGRWVDESLSNEPWWLKGIIVKGVIGGAGSVLTFIPILVIFFISMAFLENVGYMARAAFVMDRFMHIVGLHGKSFLPMCLGFGCNVPSIMGARIVESHKARLLTIFLTPFVPCTARLAAMTFVAAAIFGEKALIISWSLVTINIIALGIIGIVASRVFLKDEPVPFIMELPLYHKPDLKTIFYAVWSRISAFIKKAGSVILIFSIFMWIMSNIPGGVIENSMLAWIGRILEPIGRPFGLDWKMMVALISSIVAKENSVATLSVLYGVGEHGLMNILPSVINHASALSFLIILMLFIPCMPTIAVMKQEMGSWRWFLTSFLTMLGVSFLFGLLGYHIALAIGI